MLVTRELELEVKIAVECDLDLASPAAGSQPAISTKPGGDSALHPSQSHMGQDLRVNSIVYFRKSLFMNVEARSSEARRRITLVENKSFGENKLDRRSLSEKTPIIKPRRNKPRSCQCKKSNHR